MPHLRSTTKRRADNIFKVVLLFNARRPKEHDGAGVRDGEIVASTKARERLLEVLVYL